MPKPLCPICGSSRITLAYSGGRATADADCLACGAQWYQHKQEQLAIKRRSRRRAQSRPGGA